MWHRIWNNLLPPARRPIRWIDALPLGLFLALFAGIWIGLEATQTVVFARPQALLWLNLCPYVWWLYVVGYAGLGRWRGQVALQVRLMIIGAFVMLLAEPRSVRIRDVVSTVFAIDLSDSVGEQTEQALSFMTQIVAEKPERDEAGLVVFGRDASVELPPRMSLIFEGAINSQVDRDSTNLAESLSLSAALIPEGNQGRIVVVSDGTATEGELSPVLDELKSRNIAVDFLPVQYSYDQEVWLERLDLPQFVKPGETYEAAVLLSSLKPGRGTLILKENGNVIKEQPISFPSGKSRYALPIYLRGPGYYEYSASIQVPRDADQLAQNNTVINDLYVAGEGKVLLVTDPQGKPEDWEPFQESVLRAERVVDRKRPYELPRDAAALQPYDAIVFANVGAEQFDAVQLQAVHDSIFDLGVGFLMIGGQNSFGSGGFHRSVIEDALPVSMDVSQKKVLPKGALAIILHSCEFAEGNTWAKRITKQAIKVLNEQDEVGVLDYEGGSQWVFELATIDKYDEMVTKINAAAPGDMPEFSATMRMGFEGLEKSDASTKHMIILSDGDPAPPSPDLIQKFVDNQISVTMVAIFPHGGQEISKMRAVSTVTGGRYYFPADADELPSIFIKEAKTLKRNMVQNRTFTPELELFSPILKGIRGLPQLHGFVLTSPKPKAQTILKAPPEDSESTDTDPILATWRYGLGATAAFTSDFSPNWGADWLEWDQFDPFIKQLMIEISRVRQETNLRISTYQSGGEGVIVVEDFHPEEGFLELAARVSGPRDRQQTIPLKQVSPRRYQASLPLWGAGRYHVAAVGTGSGRKESVLGRIIVSYSPEYLKFHSSPDVIKEVTSRTGGRILNPQASAEDIYLKERQPQLSTQPLFDWWLWALACLIPLDVAMRRVQLDWHTIRSWFVRETVTVAGGQTTATLRKRRQAVAADLRNRQLDTSTAAQLRERLERGKTTGAGERTAPANAPASPKAKPTSAPPPPAADTTTGRLRELKRMRKQQQEDETQ